MNLRGEVSYGLRPKGLYIYYPDAIGQLLLLLLFVLNHEYAMKTTRSRARGEPLCLLYLSDLYI